MKVAWNEFQFKHCTIIRIISPPGSSRVSLISIQALYDYKKGTSLQALN